MPRYKKNASTVNAGATAKAGVIVLLIVASCVGYVWLKKEISSLSNNIHTLDARLKTLQDNNDKLRPLLASLSSADALDRKVKELKLGLAQPDVAHIWRLPEPPAPEAVRSAVAPLQYAAESPGQER